jgi:hypothetical protein
MDKAAHMQQFAILILPPLLENYETRDTICFEKKHIPATVKVVRKTYSFGN